MKRLKGFTLVEILVVVMIISLLITVGVLAYVKQIQKSYDSKRKSDIYKIKIALEEYEKDFDCYPDGLPACDTTGHALEDYIETIPCDPEEGTNYGYVADTVNLACPRWFGAYALLKDTNDSVISRLGCDSGCGPGSAYNFYLSSPNMP